MDVNASVVHVEARMRAGTVMDLMSFGPKHPCDLDGVRTDSIPDPTGGLLLQKQDFERARYGASRFLWLSDIDLPIPRLVCR